MSLHRIALVAVAAAFALPAAAVDLRPRAVFVEGALAEHDTVALTVGVSWPWSWRREWRSVDFTGTTELFLSHWRSLGNGGGHERTTLAALVPLVRMRFEQGRSPWFVEGGIGLSVMDSKYRTPFKEFSTSANFYDVLAVGRSFGSQRNVELSLRLTHISNGSVKRPNPGENFLQLRYGMKF